METRATGRAGWPSPPLTASRGIRPARRAGPTHFRGDILVLGASVSSLLILGIVLLASASVSEVYPGRLYSHLVSLGLGLMVAAGVGFMNYRWLQRRRLAHVLFGLALVMLALVLVPGIGESINGARRWFRWGGQPSEFAKVAFLIWCADYGARYQARLGDLRQGLVIPLLALAGTAGLIFVGPDWGTALLLAATGALVFLAAGVPVGPFAAAGAGAAAILAVLLRHDPMHWARLLSFLDLERDQRGIGWQQWHSVLSIGAGGWSGTFFGGGRHKFGFVPEQQTDFIFSLVGEELGLCGTLLFLGLYLAILGAGASIAWRAADLFGRLLALGLTALITCQALVNVGVATGSLPNKGIPLPFVSYGGSDLIALLAATGLLIAIGRHSPPLPNQPPPLDSAENDEVRARRARLQALPLGETRKWLGPAWLKTWRLGPWGRSGEGVKPYQQPPRPTL